MPDIKLSDIEGDELYELGSSNVQTQETTYKSFVNIPQLQAVDPTGVELEDFEVMIVNGWSYVAFNFDLSTVTKISYEKDDGTLHEVINPTMTEISFYGHPTTGITKIRDSSESAPSGYDLINEHDSISLDVILSGPVEDDKIIIAKDYLGAAYLPEYNFNGVGSWHNYEAMQVKTTEQIILTFTAKRHHRILDNGQIQYGGTTVFGQGWTLVAPPLKYSGMPLEEIFEPFLEDLTICKNYLGAAYLPEWNFNGVGDTVRNQGLQVKMKNNNFHVVDFIEGE